MPEEPAFHYQESYDDPVRSLSQVAPLTHGSPRPYKQHICMLTCQAENISTIYNQ